MTPAKTTFENLVTAICDVHDQLAAQVSKAVNLGLTFRNWLIGCYIREYEQNGTDRAAYGDDLLGALAGRLEKAGLKRVDARELRRYRQFYLVYPRIWESVTPELRNFLPANLLEGTPAIREAATPESRTAGRLLLARLSFTHFTELLAINDDLTRTFYEIECIKGGWSVRELRRQIASLYYERSGLSKDKKKLSALANAAAETAGPRLAIRDPYVFEFLGLKPKEVLPESEVEDALLDKLQDFLLELGRGFCFEARQRRILIGDELFFVDLVFYHRILKCHVLIELKADEFRHEHLGQLNTYVSWYRANEMQENDNPPVGILLCTRKNHALVHYALAGMANQLFVSKYQLELPSPEQMQRFLEEQLGEVAE